MPHVEIWWIIEGSWEKPVGENRLSFPAEALLLSQCTASHFCAAASCCFLSTMLVLFEMGLFCGWCQKCWWGERVLSHPAAQSSTPTFLLLSHKGGPHSHKEAGTLSCLPIPILINWPPTLTRLSEAPPDEWRKAASDFFPDLGSSFWAVAQVLWMQTVQRLQNGQIFCRAVTKWECSSIPGCEHLLGHWAVRWNPAKGQEPKEIKRLLPKRFCGNQPCFWKKVAEHSKSKIQNTKAGNFLKDKDILFISSIFLLFRCSTLQSGTVPQLGVVSAAGNQAEFGSCLHMNPGERLLTFFPCTRWVLTSDSFSFLFCLSSRNVLTSCAARMSGCRDNAVLSRQSWCVCELLQAWSIYTNAGCFRCSTRELWAGEFSA